MTATKLRTECRNKAKELVKEYYNFVSGWTSTKKPDEKPSAQYEGEEMKIGRAKQCALITVKRMMEEHSCYTLLDDRWAYWAQLEKDFKCSTIDEAQKKLLFIDKEIEMMNDKIKLQTKQLEEKYFDNAN